jgi:hypothetical protein
MNKHCVICNCVNKLQEFVVPCVVMLNDIETLLNMKQSINEMK